MDEKTNDEIIEHPFESELILYNTEKDSVHVLNETARFIFETYKKTQDLQEIETAVRSHFKIKDSQNILEEIKTYIQKLKEKKIIVEESS